MKKRCISFIRKSLIAVFCTFTAFSHCLFGYASNDDEYITFNTHEMMQAYRYFYLYGLSADTSYTYTDTYTTTGSINLGNVNISLSSNGSLGGSGTSVGSFEGMWHSFVGTGEDTYTLDISSGNIADINPYNGQTNSLTLACQFSDYTNGAYESMNCTAPTFNEGVNYNVNLNASNDVITITGSRSDTYAIFRSTANPNYDAETNSDLTLYSADSFSGSLSFNSSGGLSGSGTISATTTTTNTNKLNYVLPFMKTNDIVNPEGNNRERLSFRLTRSRPYVIAYLRTYPYQSNFSVIDYSGSYTEYNWDVIFNKAGKFNQNGYNSGLLLVSYETKIDLSNDYYNKLYYNVYSTRDFNVGIIPLYVGYKDQMSDAMYRYIYGSDRLIESIENQTNIIENGNTNSQQKEQALNTQTTQMQNQMTTFQNIEDTAGNNMNTALNNINTNPSLLSTNKFLVSVDWIRQQYNRIVTNTPFEAVITFCLVFGLGLLLLGKVR